MTPRRIHPWLFLVLYIPFGVPSGYIAVTLAYQLKHAGATVAQIAALAALNLLPQTWKFFWAPVVDTTLTQKKWYILSGIFTALGIGAMGFFPATAPGLKALSAIVFLTSLSNSLLGMAAESLVAHTTPDEQRGNVSGWFQAGNLGGSGIGGGLGLYMVAHLPAPWMASSVIGFLCFLCCAALMGVPSPEKTLVVRGVVNGIVTIFKELWEVIANRRGALAFILCFLPIGSGAVIFADIADEWHATADTVALITGTLGGVIAMIGCLIGGWCCDRMDRKNAYVWFGILQAGSGVAMALLPRSQPMFVIWASVYTLTTGLTYAAFSAFVLEAIGKGAAATKYNALASLSNVPIYYVTTLDGWSHDKWNSRGMFFMESGIAVASAVIFLALARILLGGRKPALPGSAPQ